MPKTKTKRQGKLELYTRYDPTTGKPVHAGARTVSSTGKVDPTGSLARAMVGDKGIEEAREAHKKAMKNYKPSGKKRIETVSSVKKGASGKTSSKTKVEKRKK